LPESFRGTWSSDAPAGMSGSRATLFWNSPSSRPKCAMVQEWRKLWKDSEDKFDKNEIKFAQFREKLEKADRAFDEFYLPRIDTLEMMNIALQTMIETYVINPGDWDSFSWRFNLYMHELDKGIRTLEMDYHY